MASRQLTRTEVAEWLRTSPSTLAFWAAQNPPKGPRGRRVGKKILYDEVEVERWLASLDSNDVA